MNQPPPGEPGFAPYRLVPYEKRHEDAVIEIIAGAYGEHRQEIELDTLDDDLRRIVERYPAPECVFRVLLDGERVIGSVAVKQHAAGEAELKRVFLRPEFRGKGLGRRLVEWAFAWARARGYRAMHIWSDVNYRVSHAVYRHLGAEDLRETRVLGGVNHVEEFHFLMRL